MDNESTITVRVPRELKENIISFAELNSISVSTVVREALEARISPAESHGAPSPGVLASQNVLKQIRYLYYLIDNDDAADDYQTNLVIRKEVKVLWKLCCQNLASGIPDSQNETPRS